MQQFAQWPEVQEWLSQPEVDSLDWKQKQMALEEYFDLRLADEEFYILDYEDQQRIKNNFTRAHIGDDPAPAPTQALTPPDDPELTVGRLGHQVAARFGEGLEDMARGEKLMFGERPRIPEEEITRQRTKLSPAEESKFQKWYRDIAKKTGIDENPDDPEHMYDYRGAYKAGMVPEIGMDGEYHWPSQFKDPDHPTRYVDDVDTITGQKRVLPKRDESWEGKSKFLMGLQNRPELRKQLAKDEFYQKGQEAIKRGIFPEPLPGSSGMIEEGIAGAAQFGPAMLTQAINPIAGMTAIFETIVGGKYEEYKEQGIEHERALKLAVTTAALQTPIEFAGNALQFKFLQNIALKFGSGTAGKIATFVTEFLKMGATEGTEEFLQTPPEEFINIIAANPDLTGSEIFYETMRQLPEIGKRSTYAFGVGAIGGMALGGAAGMVMTPAALSVYKSEKQKMIDEARAAEKSGEVNMLDPKPKQILEALPVEEAEPGPEGGMRVAPTRTTEPSAIPEYMMEGYKDARGLRPDEGQILPTEGLRVEKPQPGETTVKPGPRPVEARREDKSRKDMELTEPGQPRDEEALDVTHYHSGMSSNINDIKGAVEAGVPISVVLPRMAKSHFKPVTEYAKAGGDVLVDSGAFTAFTKGKEVDFDDVMSKYDDIIKASGNKVAIIAPDVIGDQEATIKLLDKYSKQLKKWADKGVKVIVPIQKGDMAPNEYWNKIKGAVGKNAVAGIPSNKAAFGTKDIKALMDQKDAPDRVHFLGIGPKSKEYSNKTKLVRGLAPTAEISSDSTTTRRLAKKIAKVKKKEQEKIIEKEFDETEDVELADEDIGDDVKYAEAIKKAKKKTGSQRARKKAVKKVLEEEKPSKRSLKSYQEEIDKLYPDEGFNVDLVGAEGEMVPPGELLITGKREGTDLYKQTFAVKADDIKAGVEKKRTGFLDEKARALAKRPTGVMYKEKVEVAETGEIVEGEREASEALKEVQSDLEGYRKLLDCIQS